VAAIGLGKAGNAFNIAGFNSCPADTMVGTATDHYFFWSINL
jgi:hypothetical protein